MNVSEPALRGSTGATRIIRQVRKRRLRRCLSRFRLACPAAGRGLTSRRATSLPPQPAPARSMNLRREELDHRVAGMGSRTSTVTLSRERESRSSPMSAALMTTWDNTDYSLHALESSDEGFLDPQFSTADWKAAADQTLGLVRREQGRHPAGTTCRRRATRRRRPLPPARATTIVKGARTYVAYYAPRFRSSGIPEWDS
jgi:hypothetical protein